jgi:hypothetical protein
MYTHSVCRHMLNNTFHRFYLTVSV